MVSRTSIIIGLIVAQGAVLCEMVIAVRGAPAGPWPGWPTDARAEASSANLVEDGPPRTFPAGAHPQLVVNIGNADLTIRAAAVDRFIVSVGKSTSFGVFDERAPIVARAEGDAVRLALHDGAWGRGDDRMVTVEVPMQTRVAVAAAGDVRAIGLRAESEFQSKIGTVDIDDFDAPALRVASSERITLSNVRARRVDIATSDGRIEGSAFVARDGSIETGDGPISLDFAEGSSGVVSADTGDGRITVPTRVDEVATGEQSGDGDVRARVLHLGNGGGHLLVHTGNGDIRLGRS